MKKEKGILVLGHKVYKDSDSIYDVIIDDESILFKYSKLQSTWNYKGETAYQLIDTGDGFMFKDRHGFEVELDYCQAEALRALLKLEDKESTATFKYYTQEKK